MLEVEAALFAVPGTQTCHAVGRHQDPVFSAAAGPDPVLVVASDGACLAQAVAQGVAPHRLPDWLSSGVARDSRDDVTCLLVSAATVE